MGDKVATLVKKDVSRRVAARMGTRLEESETWVSEVLEVLADMLMEADPEIRIELRGFGVLEVKKTRAKPKARNPRTNETIFVPSRRKTHFKPGKRIRERLQRPLRELRYSVPEASADADHT